MEDNYMVHLESTNSVKIINLETQDLRLPPPDLE
jgi:hypothetical protein